MDADEVMKLVDGAMFASVLDAQEAVLERLGLEVVAKSFVRSCGCCTDVSFVVQKKDNDYIYVTKP